jgi:hypothetical protein
MIAIPSLYWPQSTGCGRRGLFDRFGFVALIVITILARFLDVVMDFNQCMVLINDLTRLLFIPQYSPLIGHLQLRLEGKLDLSFCLPGCPRLS